MTHTHLCGTQYIHIKRKPGLPDFVPVDGEAAVWQAILTHFDNIKIVMNIFKRSQLSNEKMYLPNNRVQTYKWLPHTVEPSTEPVL